MGDKGLVSLRIDYLADHPRLIPTVASWLYDQWGYLYPGASVEDSEARLRPSYNRDTIPLGVIALLDRKPVGVACLVDHDMSTRKDLSPWLASVLVVPEHRGKGIGTALTQRIMDEAKSLGVAVLYLFTPDAEKLYARLGWTVLERTEYRGEQVVIMTIDLADQPLSHLAVIWPILLILGFLGLVIAIVLIALVVLFAWLF